MNKDITGIFQNTESNLLRGILQEGGKALGTLIKGKAGLLVKDVKFSDALQKEVEKSCGIKGFISTDELPRYGIRSAEKGKVLSAFSAGAKDVVVFVAGGATEGEKALQIIETGMAKKAAPEQGNPPKVGLRQSTQSPKGRRGGAPKMVKPTPKKTMSKASRKAKPRKQAPTKKYRKSPRKKGKR